MRGTNITRIHLHGFAGLVVEVINGVRKVRLRDQVTGKCRSKPNPSRDSQSIHGRFWDVKNEGIREANECSIVCGRLLAVS